MSDFLAQRTSGPAIPIGPASRTPPGLSAGPPAGPPSGPIDRAGRPTKSTRIDHGRAFVESVLHRAEWLSPADRQLLRSIYADGHPVARLAPMLRTGKRSLRRRVKRILDRIASRRFAFVAVRHTQWPASRKRVAASVILQGKSLRETSDTLSMSLYSVRRHYDAVNALFEASERPGV